MKSDNVAIILQKPLQEAFDTECRCYEIYLKIYESLVKVWEELKKQKGELEEKKELDEKVSSYICTSKLNKNKRQLRNNYTFSVFYFL